MVKNIFFLILIPILILSAGDYPPKGWQTSLAEAAKNAKESKKQILIDFTGSDWCIWCQKLEGEVFSKKEFKDYADKNLELVFIDFPRDKSLVDKKQQEDNQALAQLFGVRGFPSVWLLDSDLKPLLITGYQAGGAEAYLKHLKDDRIEISNDQMAKEVESFPVKIKELLKNLE